MILAAGRGERMRPLTDTTPKPLLEVAGKPLVAWHLEKLAAMGIQEVVINIAYLGERIVQALGDGARFRLRIRYSREGQPSLETGGGLLQALPLLGPEPFLLVSADVWTDFDFAELPREPAGVAHLLLVDNPPHHPAGDFRLAADGLVRSEAQAPTGREEGATALPLTYAGLGVLRPQLLTGWRGVIGHAPGARANPPRFRLAPLLHSAARDGAVTGQCHDGRWTDVGTPQRLAELDAAVRAGQAHSG